MRSVTEPVRFTVPLRISSPTEAERGRDSPVSAEVSSVVLPSSMTPSSGTRSPALTRIRAPTGTCSGATTVSTPSFRRVALSGFSSISLEMELRERPKA